MCLSVKYPTKSNVMASEGQETGRAVSYQRFDVHILATESVRLFVASYIFVIICYMWSIYFVLRTRRKIL